MTKSVVPVTKKVDEAKAEKNTAIANLLNTVSIVLVVVVVGVVISLLAKPVWDVVKFIGLIITSLVCMFYATIFLVISKKSGNSEVESGQTLRDSMHTRHGAKPVNDCTEEEKQAVVIKEEAFHGFLNLTGITMWLMPLFFGAMDKFQFVPLNYIAPVATVLSLVTWIKVFVIDNPNSLKKLDHKLTHPSVQKLALMKSTGVVLTIYFIMVVATITLSYFGITFPALPQ